MVVRGRSIQQAVEAGTFYSFRCGTLEYDPPACETPAEVAEFAVRMFPNYVGQRFEVCRIIGGTIGCRVVEHVGFWTLGESTRVEHHRASEPLTSFR